MSHGVFQKTVRLTDDLAGYPGRIFKGFFLLSVPWEALDRGL